MRFPSLRQYPASEAAIVVLPVPPLLVATTSTLAIRRSAPPVQRQFIMAEDDPNAMPALRAAPVWVFYAVGADRLRGWATEELWDERLAGHGDARRRGAGKFGIAGSGARDRRRRRGGRGPGRRGRAGGDGLAGAGMGPGVGTGPRVTCRRSLPHSPLGALG